MRKTTSPAQIAFDFDAAEVTTPAAPVLMPLDHKTLNEHIGIMGYAEVGAHNFTRYADCLDFNAKILLPGTQRVRIVKVRITLTPADLYHVEIGYLNKKTFDWVSILDDDQVYFDRLREVLNVNYIHRFGTK